MSTETSPLPTDTRALVTEKVAAEFLSVAPATLRNRRWRGIEPPYVRLGSSIRYRVQALLDYAAAGEVKA